MFHHTTMKTFLDSKNNSDEMLKISSLVSFMVSEKNIQKNFVRQNIILS